MLAAGDTLSRLCAGSWCCGPLQKTEQHQATISLNMVSTAMVCQHQECDTARTAKSSSLLVLVLWRVKLPSITSLKPNLHYQEDPPQTAQSASLFSCRWMLFGDQMLYLQQKPWSSQRAFCRAKEGHGRKSFSDCTGGNWVAELGLCHRSVHVLDFEGQVSSSSTGVWELPTAWELAPWVVLQGLLCETGGRDRSDFSSLSPHYHVQEFALPWNGVVETER